MTASPFPGSQILPSDPNLAGASRARLFLPTAGHQVPSVVSNLAGAFNASCLFLFASLSHVRQDQSDQLAYPNHSHPPFHLPLSDQESTTCRTSASNLPGYFIHARTTS